MNLIRKLEINRELIKDTIKDTYYKKKFFLYLFINSWPYIDKTYQLLYIKFDNQITICKSYKKSYKKLHLMMFAFDFMQMIAIV